MDKPKQPTVNLSLIKKDSSDTPAVRKSFRIPVKESDGITAVLNNKVYPVSDISRTGISITCEKKVAFMVAQKIENCELRFPGGSADHLCAKVIHFSSGSGQNWQNGLQWVNPDRQAQEKISALVDRMKADLLDPGKPEWE